MQLTIEKVAAYNAVKKLPDWSDKTLEKHNIDVGDLFYALMVYRELDKFSKRNNLSIDDCALICHRRTGKAFVQWMYAAGKPFPPAPVGTEFPCEQNS